MNPTAEAWFAVAGLAQLPFSIYIAGVMIWARVTGKVPGAKPQPVQPAGEYPKPRSHEPDGCWCGELHEGVPADGGPAWKAS
jgi:hypothetical protein